MRSTGIIRKMDSLGRIVIPSEIRQSYNIEIGDPVEILTNAGTVVLRRFNLGDELEQGVKDLSASLRNYGDALPNDVIDKLQNHLKEMNRLLEAVEV